MAAPHWCLCGVQWLFIHVIYIKCLGFWLERKDSWKKNDKFDTCAHEWNWHSNCPRWGFLLYSYCFHVAVEHNVEFANSLMAELFKSLMMRRNIKSTLKWLLGAKEQHYYTLNTHSLTPASSDGLQWWLSTIFCPACTPQSHGRWSLCLDEAGPQKFWLVVQLFFCPGWVSMSPVLILFFPNFSFSDR